MIGLEATLARSDARVRSVPVVDLDTRLAVLRGGRARRRGGLADLPLRVVPLTNGRFEVVDGFKRLERWRAEGAHEVPVVVEAPRTQAAARVLLLEANAPHRTLSPMDEARVVHALRVEDRLGPRAIATLCGRRVEWVTNRLALATGLAPSIAARVDAGAVGPTLALALCGVARSAQESIATAIEKHGLTVREALALVTAFRASASDEERRALLECPLAAVRSQKREESSLAARLSERLARARSALTDLRRFVVPDAGLSPGERRRLQAAHRAVLHQLTETARALEGERDEADSSNEVVHGIERERGEAEAAASIAEKALGGGACSPPRARAHEAECPRDRAEDGSRPETRTQRARGNGAAERQPAVSVADEGEQTRPVPGTDRREGRERPDGREDPPRDPRAGLRRKPNDPTRVRPLDPGPARPAQARPLPLRDTSG